MIIVTGATGRLGHAIIEKLLDRLPADKIGVSCRSPEKASIFASQGVRVRRGDFAVPHTLDDAFEGAEQILLVSSNARSQGGDPVAQHKAAIDAAARVGAQRVVYTSQIAASPMSAFPPARDHAATEKVLDCSGIAYTILRHGFYGLSGIGMLGEALKTGLLETAQDGKISWVAHDDLAEAAAIILAEGITFDGVTPPLTGPEGLDFGDLVKIASQVTGESIKRNIITDDELRQKLASRGTPTSVIKIVLGLYIAARNNEFADVNPTLANLLGRTPMSMKELMMQKLGD